MTGTGFSPPPTVGRFLAETIPDARYQEFLAAHLANIEVGQPFTDALVRFFRGSES